MGDRDLADYTYNSRNGKLSKITYGNGFIVNYVYDELDKIQSIKYNNTVAYQYEYDANGNLCKLIDKTGNRTYQYKYDDQGRLTGFYESISGTNTTSAITSMLKPSSSIATQDIIALNFVDSSALTLPSIWSPKMSMA